VNEPRLVCQVDFRGYHVPHNLRVAKTTTATKPGSIPMTNPRKNVLLSWSSGKDSAWAIHFLRQQAALYVIGLQIKFNEEFDRGTMHAVQRELVEAQADAVGCPRTLGWARPHTASYSVPRKRAQHLAPTFHGEAR
jgi:hypothetical protein